MFRNPLRKKTPLEKALKHDARKVDFVVFYSDGDEMSAGWYWYPVNGGFITKEEAIKHAMKRMKMSGIY